MTIRQHAILPSAECLTINPAGHHGRSHDASGNARIAFAWQHLRNRQ